MILSDFVTDKLFSLVLQNLTLHQLLSDLSLSSIGFILELHCLVLLCVVEVCGNRLEEKSFQVGYRDK